MMWSRAPAHLKLHLPPLSLPMPTQGNPDGIWQVFELLTSAFHGTSDPLHNLHAGASKPSPVQVFFESSVESGGVQGLREHPDDHFCYLLQHFICSNSLVGTQIFQPALGIADKTPLPPSLPLLHTAKPNIHLNRPSVQSNVWVLQRKLFENNSYLQ